jgi:hypothetical protein
LKRDTNLSFFLMFVACLDARYFDLEFIHLF